MSDEVEDDEDGATQMMSSHALAGGATADTLDGDALDEEEGDLTVPFDRGRDFAQIAARPRPAAGTPAAPRVAARPLPRMAPPIAAPVRPVVVEEMEPDLDAGSITVPVARDELPLPSVHEFGDTGEMTVPRALAPKAPGPRPVPQYDLPPPAYKPPPIPTPLHTAPSGPRAPANEPTRPQIRRPGSMPPPAPSPFMAAPPEPPQGYEYGQNTDPTQRQSRPHAQVPGYAPQLAQMPTPPPQPYAPQLAQMPTPPPQQYAPQLAQMPTPPPQQYAPQLAQMPTPPPQPYGLAPAPSSRGPSLPAAKTRSPPVFVAVMVACTVLTITGLVLLAFLKMRHFW